MSEGEKGGGEERAEGTGQVVQGLVGLGKDLRLLPQGGGNPGGLWVG